jgi:hypothetical protein
MCRDWEVIHSNPHSHILKDMFLTWIPKKKNVPNFCLIKKKCS